MDGNVTSRTVHSGSPISDCLGSSEFKSRFQALRGLGRAKFELMCLSQPPGLALLAVAAGDFYVWDFCLHWGQGGAESSESKKNEE